MRTRRRGDSSPESGSESAAPSGGRGAFKRGDDIFNEAQRHKEEIQNSKSKGFSAFRFYLKKGEECEVIILDESLKKGLALYEHSLKDSNGNWGLHEPCLKDIGGDCPICATGNNSYYALMLSVIAVRPYQTKKGKTIPHSKMIMPIKIGQFDIFRKLEAACIKKNGTMRGMSLVMARGNDAMSSRIGEPIPDDDGMVFSFLTEDELDEEFGHDEIRSEDKKTVVRAENFDITPYDYDKEFPEPDVSRIRKVYGRSGGGHNAGSTEAALREFEEEDDQIPGLEKSDKGEQSEPSIRRRRRSADAAPAPEPEATSVRRRTASRRGGGTDSADPFNA